MRYKLITQKPYCCVPACIQMILARRKLKMLSQEETGWQLGLTVPLSAKKHFKRARISNDGEKYGIDIRKFSLNNFFKKSGYKLKFSYRHPKKIKDTALFLKSQISKGNDLIACFRNDTLLGYGKYGHVAIVDSIEDGKIILADPNLKKARFRKVSPEKLMNAMRKNLKDMGGLWVISKK